jgi:PhnB protein
MPDVTPIPEGYPRVTPYLHVNGAATAIDFYTEILGAEERMRMPAPEGKIGHAELKIGESIVMLADEFPDMGVRGPKSIGGTPVTLDVYVEDVDAVFDAALAGGASSCVRSRTSSTEIASDSSKTLSAIAGASPPM